LERSLIEGREIVAGEELGGQRKIRTEITPGVNSEWRDHFIEKLSRELGEISYVTNINIFREKLNRTSHDMQSCHE
jgi:hypothetical protein